MDSAHTKGPLRVVEHQHAAGPSYAIKTVNEEGSTGTFVAVLHPRSGGKEVRANADLYAAAPDLLEALWEVTEIPVRDCPWGCDPDEGMHADTCRVSKAQRLLRCVEYGR
jgi:hypothetical protein